jgi:exopolyphosphatase/guanosine-5'-triphosphate,3'-diphosphate pyrophosphatase
MNESTPEPVAVVDIGSNSARVVVYEPEASGHLRIRASTRAALRLVRDVDSQRRLSEDAMARAMDALRDFRAIALGAGATRVVAVATAAMRDADNGLLFLERVRRELGIDVELIDGDREARYGFVGAVRGLPVDDGLAFDMGGGSMQVSRFRGRALEKDWSLPLGSLRLSQTFLGNDPPKQGEIRKLKAHVRELLQAARIPTLRAGETLVGTGGTVRNLAKIDRRARGYPITRLHGYTVTRRHLHEAVARVTETPLRKRDSIPGLSDERGDSIVGGALGIETLVEAVEAAAILVSGQGVREGIAYSMVARTVPDAPAVRRESVSALTARFTAWDRQAAARRVSVTSQLTAALLPAGAPDLVDSLAHASCVLDIGRSVDFFDRYQHAADIVLATELDGFSHREVALLSAILRTARDEEADLRPLMPVLRGEDRQSIEQAGLVLAIADDIEERCPRGSAIEVRCVSSKDEVLLDVPALAGWRPRGLDVRFAHQFGKRLAVRAGSAVQPAT